MAVQPDALIAPNGPVELSLFPGEAPDGALLERMAVYVGKAEDKTSAYTFATPEREEAAVAAWALYLAFNAAYTLSLARPAEQDAGFEVLGRVLYEDDQRQGLKDLADKYFEEWLAVIAGADDGSQVLGTGVSTHTTPLTYDY
jgi:hypothetical protein